jgi:hypothetical protein
MMALAEVHNQLAWLESTDQGRLAVQPDRREASFYRLSMSKISGMRPYTIKNGYVGIGPPIMCPGDVVVILFVNKAMSEHPNKATLPACCDCLKAKNGLWKYCKSMEPHIM